MVIFIWSSVRTFLLRRSLKDKVVFRELLHGSCGTVNSPRRLRLLRCYSGEGRVSRNRFFLTQKIRGKVFYTESPREIFYTENPKEIFYLKTKVLYCTWFLRQRLRVVLHIKTKKNVDTSSKTNTKLIKIASDTQNSLYIE